MLTRRAALLASAALPFVRPAQAQQPSTLRIAMTLADIPVTDGAPDQGTEGIRFMGYTMYDPLVTWDLSSATSPPSWSPASPPSGTRTRPTRRNGSSSCARA